MFQEGRAPVGGGTASSQNLGWGSLPCSSVPGCAVSLGRAPVIKINH